MPFTVSPSSYKGGDYLFQGISQAAQGITGAINQYAQIADQTTQSDALMKYLSQQTDPVSGKPIIDAKALEDYQNHSMRQRAFVAGGVQAGMHLTDALQKLGYANQRQEWQNRESAAHAAYYNRGNVTPDGTPFEPTTTVVKDPVTGEYKTFVRTSKGQVKPFASEKKEQDPIKVAIAKQMEGDATSPTPTPTATPPPQASGQKEAGSPVRVNSVAEAQALPPGTVFIDPQGILRRR